MGELVDAGGHRCVGGEDAARAYGFDGLGEELSEGSDVGDGNGQNPRDGSVAQEAEVRPVTVERKGIGFQGFVGSPSNSPSADPSKDPRGHSIEIWQRYASPVWFDIDMMDVLNIRQARESEDEKHICPLQLQVIARAIDLWTNEGDVVFSPFAGIGSEGYESIRMGRKFIGCELKEEYFRHAIRNIEVAEVESRQGRLFA